MRHVLTALLAAATIALAACGGGEAAPPATPPATTAGQGARFPAIRDARLTPSSGGLYTLAVTVSSPYDTPERYADGWRVLDPGGKLLGEHKLTHDHADEQPFTREQSGLRIPEGVETVVVEGRDLRNGYGGRRATVEVP